jgi:hypothetical protein
MALFVWNTEAHAWRRLNELSDIESTPRRQSITSWIVIDLDLTAEEEQAAALNWLRLYGRIERQLYRIVEMAGDISSKDLLKAAVGRDARNLGYTSRSLKGLITKRALLESHGTLTCNPIVQPAAYTPRQTVFETPADRSYVPIAQEAYRLFEAKKFGTTLSCAVTAVHFLALSGDKNYAPLLPPLAKGKRDRRKELIMRELKRLIAENKDTQTMNKT